MNNNRKTILHISLISMFGGLAFILAYAPFLTIRLSYGDIEFSDVLCFFLLIFSRKFPFIIIAIFAPFLSDLCGPFPIYAPATLISRTISTIIIVLATHKLKFNKYQDFLILAFVLLLVSVAIIFVYYINDIIIYGTSVAYLNVTSNIIQYVVVIPIVMMIAIQIPNIRKATASKLNQLN